MPPARDASSTQVEREYEYSDTGTDTGLRCCRISKTLHGISSPCVGYLSDGERAALTRCVRIMCTGMPRFQRSRSLDGLADLPELVIYVYYGSGVVGEMRTDLLEKSFASTS